VFGLAVLFPDAMGMRRDIVKFGGALVILIMRSAIVTSRHSYRLPICPDFEWASLASLYA
jgi:hypothetical protein